MMIQRTIGSLLMAAVMVAGAYGQQATQLDRQYQAALHKEMVQRDLKGAIEEYKKVAKGTDRALAAKALLRMAECYQKLGDGEATKIYEQLVRDYASQPEAAEARARLAAVTGAAAEGTVQRKVWTGPSHTYQYGRISNDGRWLLYTYNSGPDSEAGKWGLHIRDLASGTTRRLVASTILSNREQVDYRAVFSPDNRLAAYMWQVPGKIQLRTVSVNGPTAQPKVLVDSDDIAWISPHDWTPDGRLIAVDLMRKDKTSQIGLVSATDGSVRVLKSVNWDDAGAIRFSPDGKYIAFGQVNPADRASDIWVLATDASREVPAVVNKGKDSLLGWSPDGKQLLFLSDRSGSIGIWSQEFTDRPVGDPRMIKAHTGPLDGIGVTARGDLYYVNGPTPRQDNIKIASLDLTAGRVLSMPVVAVQEHVGSNQPARWSHDGSRWAYISDRAPGEVLGEVLVIRSSVDNTIERELPLNLNTRLSSLEWAADDRSFSVQGGLDGRPGVYRVDAQTGQATPIVMDRAGASIGNYQWSADGKTLYFLRLGTLDQQRRPFTLVALDVASNTETEIMRASHEGILQGTNFVVSRDGKTVYFTRRADGRDARNAIVARANEMFYAIIARDIASGNENTLWDGGTRDGNLLLSPDERYLVRSAPAPSNGQQTLIPTNGGKPRALTALKGGVALWLPDSRAVLFREASPSNAFWVVPIDGSAPKKLGLNIEGGTNQIRLHPDGHRVLFMHSPAAGPRPPSEVWMIERLVPGFSTGRK